jgi:hypothetical protein
MKSMVRVGIVAGLLGAAWASGCGSDDDDGAATGGKGGTGGTGNVDASAGTGGTAASTSGGTGGGGGNDVSPVHTGDACDMPSDCYVGLDGGSISGEAQCLDRVPDGYCTHTCETDDDCCAVPGECSNELRQVCAPFESTGLKLCFLSCEDADVVAGSAGAGGAGGAGAIDGNAFCEREANPDFICRSTGGGVDNRQVCVPEGGMAGAAGMGPIGGAGAAGAAGTAGAAGSAGAGGAGGASGASGAGP